MQSALWRQLNPRPHVIRADDCASLQQLDSLCTSQPCKQAYGSTGLHDSSASNAHLGPFRRVSSLVSCAAALSAARARPSTRSPMISASWPALAAAACRAAQLGALQQLSSAALTATGCDCISRGGDATPAPSEPVASSLSQQFSGSMDARCSCKKALALKLHSHLPRTGPAPG